MKIYKRIKRMIEFFKKIDYDYANKAWWLKRENGWQRVVLYDRNFGLLYANKIRMFIKKVRVSWLLAGWYVMKDDGLYYILEEKKDGYVLYKV